LSDQDLSKNLRQTNLENGLGVEDVKKRLELYGFNEVPDKSESFWNRLAKRFWGIVPWMLEVTVVVTIVLGEFVHAAVIVVLLFFNAGMSIWREGKARAAMAALKQRLTIQSRVKRDGKWLSLPARELVPGDLLRIRVGDLLPADTKIVEGSLGLDQSMLTGESGVVDRSVGELAFSGSAVKRGEATGIVDATGTKTYFGRTISLLDLAKPKLHMEEVTVKVARRLAIIVVTSLLVVFVYAAVVGFELAVLLPLAAVLLIASVPVAMPIMYTINMALGSVALAKQGVLVTRLSASEDAATMDVLCADKTGTITMNELFIEELLPLNGCSQNDVLIYGALASKEANQDPIDSAFLKAAAMANLSLDSFSQIEFVPFDPKTRMTKAIIQRSSEIFLAMKGSVTALCSVCNLHEQKVIEKQKLAEALSEKGLRVIAVAKSVGNNIEFVGLAGIADRIREDSRKTIDEIRDLGVEVKILTGDSLPIAKNIAERIGLGKNVTTLSMTPKNDNGEFSDSVVKESHCIAQIYPEDKFRVVKTLQRLGHVVGMTGDGVNDAPALAQAEVGIAVKNATDIAKDASSAVLTTDGLSGIVSMIKTSRIIYQKIYSWTLNMVSRKLHIAFFIVVMLFLTNSLMLSITSTLITLFLADFATMSMATDNVRPSLKPDKFDMRSLFGVGGAIGLLMTIESAIFAVPALSYFNLIGNMEKIYTFGFAYINFVGFSTILILREQNHFWKSRPSKFLSIVILAEVLLVTAVSMLGVLELAPLGYLPVLAILSYSLLTSLLINDPIKVYLIDKLKSTKNEKRSN
jgi:H+-transporting ATPase